MFSPRQLALSIAATVSLTLCACSTAPKPPTTVAEVGEFRAGSGYVNGYLGRKSLPNSLALLPPPPAEGSKAAAPNWSYFDFLSASDKIS